MSQESEFIKRLATILSPSSERVFVGIGDDAAVVASPRGKLVLTTDMLVEGVHFDLAFASFRNVGAKALAVNLSDLAAMGALPLYALVSLAIRPGLPAEWEEGLYQGIRKVAGEFGVDVVGGNISSSPVFTVDIAAVGEVETPLLRKGAKVGEGIGVTGPLGLAAAGLSWLKARGAAGIREFPQACQKQLTPWPRLRASAALVASRGVSTCIDLSDGLSTDAHHLAEASGVGLLIDETRLPLVTELTAICSKLGLDPLRLALDGGEDYELLFTYDPKSEAALKVGLERVGCPFFPIGEVISGAGVVLQRVGGGREILARKGWDHLAGR